MRNINPNLLRAILPIGLLLCAISMMAQLPENDQCTSATTIFCSSTVNGSTLTATNSDYPGACGSSAGTTVVGQQGVWFLFNGTGLPTTASLCGSEFDTQITVWGDCNSVACIAGNDDNESCGTGSLQSSVTWTAAAGSNYWIYVHGFNGSGNFTLSLSCQSPCAAPSQASFCVRLDNCPAGPPTLIDWADANGAASYQFAGARNCSGTPCDPMLNRNTTASGFTFNGGAPNNFPVFITLTTVCTAGGTQSSGMFAYTLSLANCATCPIPAAPPIDMSELEEIDLSPLFQAYKEIDVYPNPARDLLNIDLLFDLEDKATLEVMDINGKVVKAQQITDTTTQLDISDLQSGNYMLRVQSGDESVVKRFVRLAQN